MKKLKSKFFSLSLARQLLLLLGVIILIILLVIHPYVNYKINNIVDNQIYYSISNQQELLIDMVENIDGWRFSDRFYIGHQFDENSRVKHLIYYSDLSILEILTHISSQEADYLNKKLFYPLIVELELSEKNDDYGQWAVDNNLSLYYRIKESPTVKGVYWISYETYDTSDELLTIIQNELVNVFYVVIIIVALILIAWIYMMIRSLKSIVNYIQAIRQSKEFTLNLDREDEIGEVGDALVDMEKELNYQKSLQEDLIHNISHDLKTPITIIKSYSESMKDDIYPYGDKNSSLDIILENVHKLDKKVKDFLLINRLDYLRKQKPSNEMTAIHLVLENIIKEYKPLNNHIAFNVDIENTEFLGEIDHWYSCITNIIENALRYAESRIDIRLKNNELTIFNDGQPIDDKLLQDLFSPYKKGPKGNFGLGMSIVYKIVTMYGYQIIPRNQEDGVEFIIKKNT